MNDDPFTVDRFSFDGRGGTWKCLKAKAVPTFVERIVPPAGEIYAFDVQHYKRTVEIYVSPTGRSVRVFVNGEEVRP